MAKRSKKGSEGPGKPAGKRLAGKGETSPDVAEIQPKSGNKPGRRRVVKPHKVEGVIAPEKAATEQPAIANNENLIQQLKNTVEALSALIQTLEGTTVGISARITPIRAMLDGGGEAGRCEANPGDRVTHLTGLIDDKPKAFTYYSACIEADDFRQLQSEDFTPGSDHPIGAALIGLAINGLEINLGQVQLIRLPQYQFIYGGFMLGNVAAGNSRYGRLFYFEDQERGAIQFPLRGPTNYYDIPL
ncbi:MAG TPA: hypothetical protein VG122_11775 [Gemmata sp.]|jgi:hypothetical protein|nr:hypothetical protein [Gemmata sp.]